MRRAGFSLMAGLAVKARTASDAQFEAFLPLIAEASVDERNMVKKAVNWALREIGKRIPACARRASQPPGRSARGIPGRRAGWPATLCANCGGDSETSRENPSKASRPCGSAFRWRCWWPSPVARGSGGRLPMRGNRHSGRPKEWEGM